MTFTKVLLTITFFTSVVLSSSAAASTRESIEKSNANKRETPQLEEVKTEERFFRVYEDGTIEWKLVLSNGVAQYQKITKKPVCGRIIYVQEGYSSERLPDGTYRTTHYIADQNGYRILKREVDTKPPVLPVYVPYVPNLLKETEALRCSRPDPKTV